MKQKIKEIEIDELSYKLFPRFVEIYEKINEIIREVNRLGVKR
jgi:hypothetical protein